MWRALLTTIWAPEAELLRRVKQCEYSNLRFVILVDESIRRCDELTKLRFTKFGNGTPAFGEL
jgi:hypothetical protein